jgi:hypothetical protein
VRAVHAAVRARVPTLTADRPPSPDITTLATAIHTGVFDVATAEWDTLPGKAKRKPVAHAGRG